VIQKKSLTNSLSIDDIMPIGINTVLPDYKLAYFLNAALGIDLKKTADFIGIEQETFSFYIHDEGEHKNIFNLLKCTKAGIRLLPAKLHTDYLMVIRNPVSEQRLQHLVSSMRKIKEIFSVFELDLHKNKELIPLLEQIEFHEMAVLRQQPPGKTGETIK